MLVTGKQLAERYEILTPLGKGGMGEVYRSRDLRLKREVAVKILPDHLSKDRSALSRFEREATSIATLSHPNILAIYDFGVDQDIAYAVMELLEGETLRAHLSRGSLSWQRAVEIGISIVDGLAAAHSKGIIHRDIKPENIFLTSEGQVKILDFGLARQESSRPPAEVAEVPTQSYLTQQGEILGTVPYMSPEQVRGEVVDARSDLFSFGCMLFEMITRKRPFDRGSSVETLSAILRDDPPTVAQSGQAVPVRVEQTIRRCLERNPEQRYQSALELSVALKFILDGSPRPPGKFSAPKLPALLAIPAAIVLVIALLVAVVVHFQHTSRELGTQAVAEKEIQSLAILPFVTVDSNPDSEYLSDGITESIMNRLSGLSNLRVMAHDTVFSYKGKKIDPRKVGQELNVRAVVTGRVLQQGNSLVIRAELVNVSDGAQLWGEQYERKLEDVLVLQDEISRVVSEKLQLKLTGEDRKRLTKQYTDSPEAHRLYLKGLYYYWKNTEEDYDRAREYFLQAIDKDPTFALAYSELGFYYLAVAVEGYLRPIEAYPKAEAAFGRALEIDDTIADTHVGLGSLRRYNWDWQDSEREFKLALNLDPRSQRGHWNYWFYLLSVGRTDDALQQIRQAQELDPLSRTFSANVAQTLTIAGKYDEAIQELRKTIRMDPNYAAAHFSLAQVYEAKGMYGQAISESQQAYHLGSDDEAAALFGQANGSSDYLRAKKTIAQATLESLIAFAKEEYVSPIEFARLYAQLDERDEAFQWLENAYQERSPQIVFIRVIRDYDNLRSDPRFNDLVRRIGLP